MRVRLFCHDVPALSVAQAHLDPRVVIQHLGQVEVLDHRLARNVGAARNLVDLFGAVPPAAYMARYFSQPTSGNRYSLHAPWSTQDAGTPILLRSQTQTHRHFDLHLGDSPRPPASSAALATATCCATARTARWPRAPAC